MPQNNPETLIVSSSFDRPTWEPVAKHIFEKGGEVTVVEADKIALGTIPFTVQINEKSGMQVQYGDKVFDIQNLRSAWYRRTSYIADTAQDAVKQIDIDRERKAIQAAVWEQIPDTKWLNSPDRIQHAGRKISQLLLAQQLGFFIPRTVATNDWQMIENELPHNIIYKSSHPLLFGTDGVQSLFTTPFTNSQDALPVKQNPFPGIWQPLIDKSREWRITAVGDTTFDAAIYTSEDAKDDWRKHQDTPGTVTFESDSFPDTLREKCIAYLKTLGLRFGAFDFIEDHDGKITFLECNPNGQFRWIEDELGLPISAAIADELTAKRL